MTRRKSDRDQITTVYSELKEGSFLGNAQRRSKRRKSAWNLLLPLFALPLWGGFAYASTQAAWLAHVLFHPEHGGLQHEFFSRMGLSASLMTLPLVIAAIFPAFVVTNFLVYLIPPARRAMDNEDKAFPGTEYAASQKALIKLGAIVCVIAVALALIGAAIGANVART
jgi:hypothetical protein